MKILLAPSETKVVGGETPFQPEELFFKALHPLQQQIVTRYQNTLLNASDEALSQMLGIKKLDNIPHYRNAIVHAPTVKAIERYSGVAFDYMGYSRLDTHAQTYIDNHVILFSNLFGILKANDLIPEYKLKQGEPIGDIKTNKLYKASVTQILDAYLSDEDILDIRAGYYDKFYTPDKPYTTLKFVKNGKVVSHWAKAYRGKVLSEIAKHQINSLEEFMKLEIANLRIDEIQTIKNKTQIIYNIIGET